MNITRSTLSCGQGGQEAVPIDTVETAVSAKMEVFFRKNIMCPHVYEKLAFEGMITAVYLQRDVEGVVYKGDELRYMCSNWACSKKPGHPNDWVALKEFNLNSQNMDI